MIKINNLSKIYESNGNKQVALDGVSLNLPEKGLVAIFGASGCGKTTLLNLLGGLDRPTSGSIVIDDLDTSLFTNKDWDSYRNQKVGFIFQNYYLLPHLTVFENVALAMQMEKADNVKEKVEKALEEVHVAHLKSRYPKSLSGGEMQRVAIARALINHPSIVLADEPTGALDKENAKTVMEILKEISKDYLVLVVTHNEKLAETYADRLLEISYGKIVSDSAPLEDRSSKQTSKLQKVHIPLVQQMKWGVRNLYKKKSRSIPIMAASAIGLAAVGIVLSMMVGISNYTKKAQEDSLSDYPLYISCYSNNSPQAHEKDLVEYPTSEEIVIGKLDPGEVSHITMMQDDFLSYMDAMPESLYSFKDTATTINFPILSKSADIYESISSTYAFASLAPSMDKIGFINQEYDVLTGHLPSNKNEVVLVVDTFNRIDASILESLGFDVTQDRLSFDDIMAKEYRVIDLDDLYVETTNSETGNRCFYRKGATYYEDLYENHCDLTLNITGIIRQKKGSSSDLYSTGILYSPLLTEYIKTSHASSQVILTQLEYGTSINALNGYAFENRESGSYIYTPEYQYESNLYNLGYKERITTIYYYTPTFEDRISITNYYNAYEAPEDAPVVLRFRDYLEQITSSFSSLVNTFSSIVLIFALVSIFIAAILTGILMYISVIERTKEIGLLRSLGARKKDVSMMIMTESIFTGLLSAITGVILIVILLPLSGRITVDLISYFGSSAIKPTIADLATFQWWVIPVVLLGSIALAIVSSIIPALIAGNKKPVDALRE